MPKKKTELPKPREISIMWDMGVPVTEQQWLNAVASSLPPALAEVLRERLPGSTTNVNEAQPIGAVLEHAYRGQNKTRVLARAQLELGTAVQFHFDELFRTFDAVLAIDSNWPVPVVGRDSVCVAAALVRYKNGKGDLELFEFANADCHPDRFVLAGLIARLTRAPQRPEGARVAFITDSMLGDLARLQSREAAVLDDIYVPAWATLIHASDRSADTWANQLLKRCDSLARQGLAFVHQGKHLGPLAIAPHVSYVRMSSVRLPDGILG
jgi:hypothetical protein